MQVSKDKCESGANNREIWIKGQRGLTCFTTSFVISFCKRISQKRDKEVSRKLDRNPPNSFPAEKISRFLSLH